MIEISQWVIGNKADFPNRSIIDYNRKNLPESIPFILHLHRSQSDSLKFLNCFLMLLEIILISTLTKATSLLKSCYSVYDIEVRTPQKMTTLSPRY